MSTSMSDNWERGSPYETYMGRWSRGIAPLFLSWLNVPGGKRWLDVGCGTGALSSAILDRCAPSSLIGVEPSDGFLATAARNLDGRARVLSGSATALPVDDAACDVVASALVLNFIPDLPAALEEMARVTATGGTVSAYVWDYADGMEITRYFWDAAVAVDAAAAPLHEGSRFPQCNPTSLRAAFQSAFTRVDVAPLELTAAFADFDDYWRPFLGGQGPAPAYTMSLADERRVALRERLRASLPTTVDGRVELRARAWAVRGERRGA